MRRKLKLITEINKGEEALREGGGKWRNTVLKDPEFKPYVLPRFVLNVKDNWRNVILNDESQVPKLNNPTQLKPNCNVKLSSGPPNANVSSVPVSSVPDYGVHEYNKMILKPFLGWS